MAVWDKYSVDLCIAVGDRWPITYSSFDQLLNALDATWFNTWSVLMDGTAYDEAYETYKLTQELLDDLDIAIGRRGNGTGV